MATTTNYGWTTPDDTALVKDGAAAIRTLGSSVDTTTKALNPSTTLGDIEYRSSTANTNTRLGIGTTGQVLSVSGGVPAWSTPASASSASATASVAGTENTTSTSYAGLTTACAVTLTTGTKALVINGCEMLNQNTSEAQINLSFAISGATTQAATDARSVALFSSAVNRPKVGGTRAILVTGLTAGSNTFTQQAKVNEGTGGVTNRNILVIDMGS
jgi:hypothetical protein